MENQMWPYRSSLQYLVLYSLRNINLVVLYIYLKGNKALLNMFLKLKTDLDQMILIENYYNVSPKKILLLLCIRGFYLNILTQ